MFSVVRGVLLAPLPFQQPERLVSFRPGEFVANQETGFWRARTRSFEQVAAVSPGWLMALVVDGLEPMKVTGGRTSGNFFATLQAARTAAMTRIGSSVNVTGSWVRPIAARTRMFPPAEPPGWIRCGR